MDLPEIEHKTQETAEAQVKEENKIQDCFRELMAVLKRHRISNAVCILEIGPVVYEVDHSFPGPVAMHRKLGLLEFSTQGLRARLAERNRMTVQDPKAGGQ